MCYTLFVTACTAIWEVHFDISCTQGYTDCDSKLIVAGLTNVSGGLIPGAVKEETFITFCLICSSDFIIIL